MLVLHYPRHMQILDASVTIESIDEWLNEWRRWTLGEVGPDFPICISASKWICPILLFVRSRVVGGLNAQYA